MKRKPQKAPVQQPDRIITIVIQGNATHGRLIESVIGDNVSIDEVVSLTEAFLNKARRAQIAALEQQAKKAQAPAEQPQQNTEHPQEKAPVTEAQP